MKRNRYEGKRTSESASPKAEGKDLREERRAGNKHPDLARVFCVANYRAEAAMQAAREKNVRQANEDGSSGRAQLHGCNLGLWSPLAA